MKPDSVLKFPFHIAILLPWPQKNLNMLKNIFDRLKSKQSYKVSVMKED